jgi:hypothetical protein
MSASAQLPSTSSEAEIASASPTWGLFRQARLDAAGSSSRDTYNRLRNNFKSHCSTYRRAHPTDDCTYETRWPIYLARNVLPSPAAQRSAASSSPAPTVAAVVPRPAVIASAVPSSFRPPATSSSILPAASVAIPAHHVDGIAEAIVQEVQKRLLAIPQVSRLLFQTLPPHSALTSPSSSSSPLSFPPSPASSNSSSLSSSSSSSPGVAVTSLTAATGSSPQQESRLSLSPQDGAVVPYAASGEQVPQKPSCALLATSPSLPSSIGTAAVPVPPNAQSCSARSVPVVPLRLSSLLEVPCATSSCTKLEQLIQDLQSQKQEEHRQLFTATEHISELSQQVAQLKDDVHQSAQLRDEAESRWRESMQELAEQQRESTQQLDELQDALMEAQRRVLEAEKQPAPVDVESNPKRQRTRPVPGETADIERKSEVSSHHGEARECTQQTATASLPQRRAVVDLSGDDQDQLLRPSVSTSTSPIDYRLKPRPANYTPSSSRSIGSSSPQLPTQHEGTDPDKYNGCDFVDPRQPDRRWRLQTLAKGSTARVCIGIPPEGSSPPVAIKFALRPSRQPEFAAELVKEAKMTVAAGFSCPDAVCRLYHQPKADDPVLTLPDGRTQPVFMAMELALCDFHELHRRNALSTPATFEAFLLSFRALSAVHRSGVLHRDLKLNNIAFVVKQGIVSARIIDFGASHRLREGSRGPSDFGRCKSAYASINRHRGGEQGVRDDLEMLLYVFLDVVLPGGLPWKSKQTREPHSKTEAEQAEMARKKHSFRHNHVPGSRGEHALLKMLTALCEDGPSSGISAHTTMEESLRQAWRACEHHPRQSATQRTLIDCISVMQAE